METPHGDPPPQVYNADGEFLFKFGSHGEGNGQFNAPTGVAVDANGNIIVADWGNSRIQVGPAPFLHLSSQHGPLLAVGLGRDWVWAESGVCGPTLGLSHSVVKVARAH